MIIPAVLEKDFEEVKNKIELLGNTCNNFQIDIVDNTIVKGITFLDIDKVNLLNTNAKIELDLMVYNPEFYVSKKIKNITKACAYYNKESKIQDFIQNSKKCEYKTGLSINYDTNLEEIDSFIKEIDYLQVMGVDPGGQGRPFNNNAIEKVKEVQNRYNNLEVQIDGGINLKTIILLSKLQLNNYIIGSAIFKKEDPISEYKKFKEIINER